MNFTKTIINAIKYWVNNKLNNYVEAVEGKGLSTEDYTTEEKEKLAGIEIGAEVNVQADWMQADDTQDSFIKNKPYEETEDDALEMLNEMGVLEATTNEEGFVLTDENGNILTV